ncbi:Response regulator [Candidatus Rhodobacter oscarellae]|uniref:Response regulator n=1 Tax=Candidatus Rhodobacter oscarellae TaxID=1675527 RepID=A0A0J9H1G1_9RHOB|nr:response regulator [Candidatus Rhodobacter lobularis]KMW59583.1 Response regulator [Candidatus Rhodobacter lobularis]
MPISLDPLPLSPVVTASRPLAGMTVLVVEDSRFASEAVRLLCLKSGARIRRADSLRAASRHLAGYAPTVIIVDLGLPDGSGLDLIRDLAAAHNRIPVILATSGDDCGFVEAVEAGADGTLLKPLDSLLDFQNAVLDALPEEIRPEGLRLVSSETIEPDRIALQDDFAHIADILTEADDDETVDYVAQFLQGLARTAQDPDLERAARSLAAHSSDGGSIRSDLARVAGLLQQRIEGRKVI